MSKQKKDSKKANEKVSEQVTEEVRIGEGDSNPALMRTSSRILPSDKVSKILYGGDYNPEQFPEEIWEEDMKLLKEANVDVLTLNVFSWAALQPSEDEYNFDKLDKIMKMVKENGFKVCLATSTAAHPAWMARKHPDILRVDFNGMKRKFGSRHNSCPSSETYRKYSVLLAQHIAERYKDYDNIVAWHIANEYGGACYCENCENGFREWLKKRYKNIEAVNKAWNTSFWSHTFYDWEDIVAPNMLSEHFSENGTTFQGISLDYKRYMSERISECCKLEVDAVRKITPNIPITTNMMGTYKDLDYAKWAPILDFISWDNYPMYSDHYTTTSMAHDIMRGIGRGRPFALMEQTPSVTNWQPFNLAKRPGVLRLLSYQAVAHGADTVMYFQMRRSIGACEKYHGAIIEHAGTSNTRVFREASAIGAELKKLGDLTLGARSDAKVALYFDWENWWAIEFSAGPSVRLKYLDEVRKYYRALNRLMIPVDMIGTDADLSKYEVVIAPVLYMIKDDFDVKIRHFVKMGGKFVTTFFSGYVNETDLVTMGGYPGKIRDIMGIWAEEEDALPPEMTNSFTYNNRTYEANIICDIIHSEGAEVLATYHKDFYSGAPALTCNRFGNGKAFYVATSSTDDFYKAFLGEICKDHIIPEVASAADDIEACVRCGDKGRFIFLLNHGDREARFMMDIDCADALSGAVYRSGVVNVIEPKGVRILGRDIDFMRSIANNNKEEA